MTTEKFKQMFLALINWGWEGDYAAELTAKANNPAQLSKIFSRTRLAAYRAHISEHDALISLIERGKV